MESARLHDLEMRITHLERGLQELSDVLIRQQKELDRTVERNQVLAQRLAALQESDDGTSVREERPPHY
ncbi:MAG TPA: SlyX family protein [Steroidobacteraceae bacterium]